VGRAWNVAPVAAACKPPVDATVHGQCSGRGGRPLERIEDAGGRSHRQSLHGPVSTHLPWPSLSSTAADRRRSARPTTLPTSARL